MPQIYDISLTISPSIPVWPGDMHPEFQHATKIDQGDMANVSLMHMSVHTGTHVDAPCHFLNGKDSVENLPLEILIGEATVIELPDIDTITANDLKHIPENTTRLLLKTRNSKQWAKNPTEFDENYVGIEEDAAAYLVERGVKLIGVDYLSVAPFNNQVPTHEILLKANTIIVEGLNLAKVPAGQYNLYCLPLKIAGADGAPARAILVK